MTPLRYVLVAMLAAALLAGCGEKKETLGDATAVYGPGVTATAPPWKPEYAHLKQRIKELGLPPVGNEKYHTHALIHIYNDGLLVQIAPNIGIDPRTKAYSSIHTHDPSGIIHMESARPHKFTLGDFFAIWGVPFGKSTLGNFKASGDKQIHVYVNGKPISDPVHYVMHDQDNISIGYGTDSSFPHAPDKSALKTVSGKGRQGTCSKARNGKPATSCMKQATG